MPNITLRNEAVDQPGNNLPSERHIFPGTTPNPFHPHFTPSSSPRRSEMIVCTDSKGLFTRLVIEGRPQHPRTEPACPWQNGRVERFIGTVKRALATEPIADERDVTDVLRDVRTWYNHDRPHDHLLDRTPAEVWAGIDVFALYARPERGIQRQESG